MGLLACRVLLTQTQTVSHIPKGFLYMMPRDDSIFGWLKRDFALTWPFFIISSSASCGLAEIHSILTYSILCRFSWEMRGRQEWFYIECCVDGLSKRPPLGCDDQSSSPWNTARRLRCILLFTCIHVLCIYQMHIYKSKHPNSRAGWTATAIGASDALCALLHHTHLCCAPVCSYSWDKRGRVWEWI